MSKLDNILLVILKANITNLLSTDKVILKKYNYCITFGLKFLNCLRAKIILITCLKA